MSRHPDWDAARKRDAARVEQPKAEVVAWWWIPADKESTCHRCCHAVPFGRPLAYSHHAQMVLCEVCVDETGLVPRPSKRWLRAQASAEKRAHKRPPKSKRHKRSPRSST